jgi:hypothetical protein
MLYFFKLRNYLSDWCLRTLYHAYVHPHNLYGVEIYGNMTSMYLILKSYKKSIIRYCVFCNIKKLKLA